MMHCSIFTETEKKRKELHKTTTIAVTTIINRQKQNTSRQKEDKTCLFHSIVQSLLFRNLCTS